MPLSNYPNGFNNGVSILGLPILNLYGGDVFWVSSESGASDSNSGAFNSPLATVDGAIGKTTANSGDQIFVKANHAETITGAGGWALDVAGVTITGLGKGKSKPRLLMDGGTTVTALVSAADVTIRNIEFAAGHASVVACLVTTATGTVLEDIDFTDNTASEMFVTAIATTGAAAEGANGLTVRRCTWTSVETTCIGFVTLVEDISRMTIEDCRLTVDLSANTRIVAQTTGKDMRGTLVRNNFISTANTDQITSITNNDTTTANSGFFISNYCKHLDATTGHLLFPAGGVLSNHDNQSASVTNLQGFLLPVVDS